MASLSEAKAMGGIGSVLVLLTPVPSVGWLLGIVGFILTLIAIRSISVIVEDRDIFNNMVIAIILAIVAVVVAGLAIIGAFLAVIGVGGFGGMSAGVPPNLQQGNWVAFALAIIPGLIAVWIMLIISAVFLRKSYSSIATKLDVGLFDTAALIYLIGAITAVIAIGFVLILVAEILFAVAFFSIREKETAKNPTLPA
ncbi:MAG TPA: DUF996 domain-containing protein [Thermoplasmataceae archaeon]|nr:DUF996 domain-containing protein [Thermoplasmataceae archaeon]